MSNLIINKSSSKYAVISLGIAVFLLAFLFTCLFIGNKFSAKSNGNTTAIYELVAGHPANAKDLILHEIEDLNKLEVKSSELISKSDALKFFQNEINKDALAELKTNNPFQDLLTVDFNTELSTVNVQSLRQVKLKFDNFISRVEVNSFGNTFNWASDGLPKILFPFIFLTSIFCLIIVSGSINNDLNLNKLEIKKTIIAGINPDVLYKNIRSTVFSNLLWSILIALVLYIVTFYLISQYLNVNFSDFGYYIFVKPIFTSILLVLICLLIITHYKVGNFLKSI